ncbi:MAG: phosphonate ABC transporter, permease protein PhnE [Spirochaetales bacterium]|nr:phosphonate ABC transporter, permease protein PhnE [Spirochaetales bacterium]
MNDIQTIHLIPSKQKAFYIVFGAGLVILIVASFLWLDLKVTSGFNGLKKALMFMGRLILMDFSDWKSVLVSAGESMSVAILSTILSAVAAFFFSFAAAFNVSPQAVSSLVKGLAAAIRAIPTIIWTLIFVAYLGFGPFPGVLGLFFHSFAYLVKAFSESIEEVKPGCIEAMRSTGSSWLQIMARGVVPTIKTSLISWTAMRFEINVGQSTILGLVGAGGVGYELSKTMRIYNFNQAGFVLLVIFVMSFGIEVLFHKLKLTVDKRQLDL